MTDNDFRRIRDDLFKAFDIYKSNVLYGIEIETEAEHSEILNWYQTLLDLPDDLQTYRDSPTKIKQYLPQFR